MLSPSLHSYYQSLLFRSPVFVSLKKSLLELNSETIFMLYVGNVLIGNGVAISKLCSQQHN